MNAHPGWTPPPRPAWVEHLNAMGRGLGDPAALVSLDADEMLAAARRSTGLSDFGHGSWEPNYRILVDAIAGEAKLHVAGRVLTRSEIMRSLRNRLFVEAYLEAHPDALDQPVDSPLIVCGYGRSGTSITQELLALDPNHRAPLAWELFNLSPLSSDAPSDVAPRISFAEGEQLFYEDVVPEYRTMHENGAELPDAHDGGRSHRRVSLRVPHAPGDAASVAGPSVGAQGPDTSRTLGGALQRLSGRMSRPPPSGPTQDDPFDILADGCTPMDEE